MSSQTLKNPKWTQNQQLQSSNTAPQRHWPWLFCAYAALHTLNELTALWGLEGLRHSLKLQPALIAVGGPGQAVCPEGQQLQARQVGNSTAEARN